MSDLVTPVILCVLALFLSSCGSSLKTTSTVKPSNDYYTVEPLPVKKTELHPVSTVTTKEVKVKDKEHKYSQLQLHFAKQLGVSPSQINNISLYQFINHWLGTKYKYGGRSLSGVDCSDFASILFDSVYSELISGSCAVLFNSAVPVRRNELQEGDLIFFKIKKGRVSHVGVYLQNDKFIHASVHSGVIISDLNEEYYKKYFYSGGRIKNS